MSASPLRGSLAVATFYVLPPRPLFGQQVLQFLLNWFPGLKCDALTCGDLAETVKRTAGRLPGVFILFREDLPEGVEMQQSLHRQLRRGTGRRNRGSGSSLGPAVGGSPLPPPGQRSQLRTWENNLNIFGSRTQA